MACVSCTVLWCPSSTVEAATCWADARPVGSWSPKVRVLMVWVVLNCSNATCRGEAHPAREDGKEKQIGAIRWVSYGMKWGTEDGLYEFDQISSG